MQRTPPTATCSLAIYNVMQNLFTTNGVYRKHMHALTGLIQLYTRSRKPQVKKRECKRLWSHSSHYGEYRHVCTVLWGSKPICLYTNFANLQPYVFSTVKTCLMKSSRCLHVQLSFTNFEVHPKKHSCRNLKTYVLYGNTDTGQCTSAVTLVSV